MSDPATPAPAASGGGGSNKPSLVTIVIVVFLVVFSNIIGYATNQLSNLLQAAKFNMGIILIIGAFILFYKGMKK